MATLQKDRPVMQLEQELQEFFIDYLSEQNYNAGGVYNEKEGDYGAIWGHPLVIRGNGMLYLCEHGYPLVLLLDGQHTYLSKGHQCDFKPRE